MTPDHEFLGSDPFATLDVPPQLEESLARHRQHLVELVGAMKSAGVGEDRIDESVSELMASYKEELIAAVRSLKR